MRRGFSLVEAVLSAFLLTCVLLASIAVLHGLLDYSRRAEERTLAALAAENRLDEIREWARDYDNFQSDWSAIEGSEVTDPDLSGVSVRADVLRHAVYSPSSELESVYGAGARCLSSTVVQVKVTALWGADHELPLLGLVGAPRQQPRQPDPVQVTPVGSVPNPFSRDQQAEFRAEAFDQADRLIPDLTFTWWVEPAAPQAGMGLVSPQTRDGARATFLHASRRTDGTTVYYPGTCRLAACAYYRGQALIGYSDVLTLAP